jgi:hypothetical protein
MDQHHKQVALPQGLGFKVGVKGLAFRVQGLGFGALGSW